MKTFGLTTALILFCAAAAIAAPRDLIDPKDIKEKVSVTLATKGMIQFKQQGDILSEPKLVKNAAEDKPGISVELRQKDEILTLIVKNRFSKILRYRAAARLKGRKEYVETSIVPVMAGLFSFENWQDPIEELILFDFKLTDEKP